MVMEHCSGGDLFEALLNPANGATPAAGARMPETLARTLFLPVFQAVWYLFYRCGILHRDLKPENIVLSEPMIYTDVAATNVRLKLADFGAAYQVPPEMGPRVRLARSPVLENHWVGEQGTLTYRAPERFELKDVSGLPAEVWSLGVVLYIVVLGFHPFQSRGGMTSADTIADIKSAQFGQVKPWWPRASPAFRDLIRSIFVVNPQERITLDACLLHPWWFQS
jgi:serine/threonine protein kinase